MKLYNYVEENSDIIHWVIAKTEKLAKIRVLDYINQAYEKDDPEYVLSEELKKLEMSEDSEFTFYSDTHNPISHTKSEWETIYSSIDQPVLYLACSEY